MVANGVNLLVIMVGWAVFRAGSLEQAGQMLWAMVHPGLVGAAGEWATPDVITAAVVAGAVSLLPRVPGFGRLRHAVIIWPPGLFVMRLGISLLFVLAVMKALADPFKPFLYFRF